jgi:hypothetical protein
MVGICVGRVQCALTEDHGPRLEASLATGLKPHRTDLGPFKRSTLSAKHAFSEARFQRSTLSAKHAFEVAFAPDLRTPWRARTKTWGKSSKKWRETAENGAFLARPKRH